MTAQVEGHEPVVERDRAVTLCGRCGSLWPCLVVFQHRAAVIAEGERHEPGETVWRTYHFGWFGSGGPIEVRICARCLCDWPCRERLAARAAAEAR